MDLAHADRAMGVSRNVRPSLAGDSDLVRLNYAMLGTETDCSTEYSPDPMIGATPIPT